MEPYATELFVFQLPVGHFSIPPSYSYFLGSPCFKWPTNRHDNTARHWDHQSRRGCHAPIRCAHKRARQRDFTILDNKVPQTITFFRALRGREAPIEVILVIDDVNTGGAHIAYERSEVDKFLRLDGGNLAHPVALAIFADSGVKIQDEFTTDGKALSAVLDQYTIGQHSIPRSGGIYGAMERFRLSIVALHQIAVREVTRPGRKIVLWISPSWPLLAGPSSQLNSTERQQAFTDIVTLSTLLR